MRKRYNATFHVHYLPYSIIRLYSLRFFKYCLPNFALKSPKKWFGACEIDLYVFIEAVFFYYVFYPELGNRLAENGLSITHKSLITDRLYSLKWWYNSLVCKNIAPNWKYSLHFHRKMYDLLPVQDRPSPFWPVLSLNVSLPIILHILSIYMTYKDSWHLKSFRWGTVRSAQMQPGGLHPFFCPRLYIFIIFAATLHIWRLSPPTAACGRAMPFWKMADLTWRLKPPPSFEVLAVVTTRTSRSTWRRILKGSTLKQVSRLIVLYFLLVFCTQPFKEIVNYSYIAKCLCLIVNKKILFI
jgi:hypothetical protein